MIFNRATTLTFVPNKFCNLGCKYCYLGNQTEIKESTNDITNCLSGIIEEFHKEGIVIDCFILHGAEVTTIKKSDLVKLLEYLNEYRNKYNTEINTFGSRKPFIHIKTNLYNLENYIDILEKYGVSISGSLDLPFIIHDKYRVTKNNLPTSNKILENVKLLQNYKFGKQLSCVVTKEVLNYKDEFIEDLIYLNKNLKFDINSDFYIMFSYDSNSAIEKHKSLENATMLSQDELKSFYLYLKDKFINTDYYSGFLYNWFKEFLPSYCTFKHNCGDNFLIQKNGDVYPCHRGQANKKFYFGNIIKNGLKNIQEAGYKIIKKIENEQTVNKDCLKCGYFKYCYLNCTLIREETKMDKSYTCSLQKELYKDNPGRFPDLKGTRENNEAITNFVLENNIKSFYNDDIELNYNGTDELFDTKNHIKSIIKKDVTLSNMYEINSILLGVNDKKYMLFPNVDLLVNNGTFEFDKEDKIYIYINKEYFKINTPESDIENNSLYLMFLRDTYHVYGDEERTKQEHINNFEIYHSEIRKLNSDLMNYYKIDITSLLDIIKGNFMDNVENMLYITTARARDYHYQKQAKNGFYHIQALNLPFHFIKFLYNKEI